MVFATSNADLRHKGIAAFERQWDYDASYLHEIIDVSPRAAWMFSRAAAIGKYRTDAPLAALAAAGITAVRHEDCGPCTQLGVSMFEKAGVDPSTLRRAPWAGVPIATVYAVPAAVVPDGLAALWFVPPAAAHNCDTCACACPRNSSVSTPCATPFWLVTTTTL